MAFVTFLMGGDGIVHYGSSYAYPILRYEGLPSLFHELTGSDPLVIWISWIAVGAVAYLGLLGWSLALLWTSRR